MCCFTSAVELASPLSGALFTAYRALAAEHGIWISFGGFHEQPITSPAAPARGGSPNVDHDDTRIRNTHVIVDAAGEVAAAYRKVHLFDVNIPDGPQLRESRSTAPGADLVTCEHSPIGCLGLSVCYDLRFPEVYSALRDRGAEVLLMPSAFMVKTGQAHWHTLLRARAIETQCFVVAAAQCGAHNPRRSSYGHSLVVDPWGSCAVRAGFAREAGDMITQPLYKNAAVLLDLGDSLQAACVPAGGDHAESPAAADPDPSNSAPASAGPPSANAAGVVVIGVEGAGKLGLVTLDFDVLETTRKNLPVWQHRRPDVYAAAAVGNTTAQATPSSKTVDVDDQ